MANKRYRDVVNPAMDFEYHYCAECDEEYCLPEALTKCVICGTEFEGEE